MANRTEENMEVSQPSQPTNDVSGVSQPKLARHDSRLLDLAFALDTTSSMSSYIHSACDNIRRIVEEIVAKESSDLRLALVEYRDHPPQDSTYVTQVHDFTPSVGTMKKWLKNSKAHGGGDLPEAVADALHDVLKLSWRTDATKICVLISDAPPHGLSQSGDQFPEGCPVGHDPVDLTRKLAEKGVTLYAVGCEPALTPYKDFFAALAYITGGQYVPLSAAGALTAVIVGGAQEELSLEQWMAQVNEMVMQEVQQQGTDNVSHEHLSRHVMDKLSHAGVRSKQLQRNKAVLESASEEAVAYSHLTNMEAIRSKFKPQKAAPMMRPVRSGGGDGSKKRRSRGAAMPPGAMAAPAAPMMANAFGAPPSVVTDDYETGEGELQMQQAQRMVQKSLARNKISLSKK